MDLMLYIPIGILTFYAIWVGYNLHNPAARVVSIGLTLTGFLGIVVIRWLFLNEPDCYLEIGMWSFIIAGVNLTSALMLQGFQEADLFKEGE